MRLFKFAATLAGVAGVALATTAGPASAAKAPGEFLLQNFAHNTHVCLTATTEDKADTGDCDSAAGRQWTAPRVSNYVFQLKNVATGKCLASFPDGSVSLHDCQDSKVLHWERDTGPGNGFMLKNVDNEGCLDRSAGFDVRTGACDINELEMRWVQTWTD